jgi:hypothetical protein
VRNRVAAPVALLIALVGVAGLAACGSDGDTGTSVASESAATSDGPTSPAVEDQTAETVTGVTTGKVVLTQHFTEGVATESAPGYEIQVTLEDGSTRMIPVDDDILRNEIWPDGKTAPVTIEVVDGQERVTGRSD